MSGMRDLNQQEENTRKPDGGSGTTSADHVNIKVNGQDGKEVFFKVRKNAHLRKVMGEYCRRRCMDQRTVTFLLDGQQITGNQTPEELELSDGDEIDAMFHHHGGGGGGANSVFL